MLTKTIKNDLNEVAPLREKQKTYIRFAPARDGINKT